MSVALVVGLSWSLDPGQIAARLGQMEAWWIGLALAVSVVQVVASAWRWRFTAGRLGIDLPFGEAVREYYLAMFLNQVIPGGVVGDVSRAWRHARQQTGDYASGGSAVRAVILERGSGQVVMAAVAVLSMATLPVGLGGGWWLTAFGTGIVVAGLWAARRARDGYGPPWLRMFWRDTRRALFSGRALPAQILSSMVVVGSYLITYLMASRSVGVDTPATVLLPLVAPVLVAMLVPVTVAGWGVREGAAAMLWGAAGLAVVDGVAISVAYGLIVLLSTLPGGVLLLSRMRMARMQ